MCACDLGMFFLFFYFLFFLGFYMGLDVVLLESGSALDLDRWLLSRLIIGSFVVSSDGG